MWHHDVTNTRTCQFFLRLFDRLPVRISNSDLHHRILRKKLYHIRAYDFGVQFSFNLVLSGFAHHKSDFGWSTFGCVLWSVVGEVAPPVPPGPG